jgi:hypothetical protein
LSEYSAYIFPLISGVVIALVTQIVAHYFSEKSLKAQQANALQIARTQLYHEDRKDAVLKLDELIKKNYKTYPVFRNAVNTFLDSSSGLFLPVALKRELRKQLLELDAFLQEKEFEIYGEPEEDPHAEEEYESWFSDLSPDEQLDVEIEQKLESVKGNMRDKIQKHMSDE